MQNRRLLRDTFGISLTFAMLTALSGVAMVGFPQYCEYIRPVHGELGLLGFGGVLLCGLAAGLLPRWAGGPLHNVRLARLQIWLVALGALLVSIGLPGAPTGRPFSSLLAAGGIIVVLAWLALFYNLLRTLPYGRSGAAKMARVYFLTGAVLGLTAQIIALFKRAFDLDRALVDLASDRFYMYGFIGLMFFGLGYGYVAEHSRWGYSWALIGLLQLLTLVLGTVAVSLLPATHFGWRETPGQSLYALGCLLFVVQMWPRGPQDEDERGS
jgi:hypothetical protein